MATRFRFRLQPLLKLRKSLEEAAQRHLARRLAERQEALTHLEALQQAHAEALEGRRARPGEVLDLQHWRSTERFLVVLERRMIDAAAELRAADQRVAEARQALTRAHQAHLTLLRLKERRQEQHDFAQLLEELRAVDEMAVLRHRFNTR